VTVSLGERSYVIDIGEGKLASVGETLRSLRAGGRVAVVTDTHVGPLYAAKVTDSLGRAGFTHRTFTIPAGEESKSVRRLVELWNGFIESGMDRNSTVVAVGGGVVGDLAGFAAATFMRGIRLVQVPTTVVACVDSAVGGKTAVDLESGKNLVGAFHQPAAVLVDPAALRTLPPRELRAGLAEVIKYGVIMDERLFGDLEAGIERLLRSEPDFTGEVIRRCCELKAEVTAQDERDAGRRAILNYGHTVGHALEKVAGFGTLLHGEAVAAGMVAASRIAGKLRLVAGDVTSRQKVLLERTGLPVTLGQANSAAVIEAMRRDKKTTEGRLNLVLPTRIGQVLVVKDVAPETVAEVLEEMHGG
jgi:3-dehydroquinate synthase